jgi:hypothetical protein
VYSIFVSPLAVFILAWPTWGWLIVSLNLLSHMCPVGAAEADLPDKHLQALLPIASLQAPYTQQIPKIKLSHKYPRLRRSVTRKRSAWFLNRRTERVPRADRAH